MRISERIVRSLLMCLVAFFFLPPATYAESPTKVFVSILPQKYFLQKIGKEKLEVHVMVMPGADPHTYEPRPRQMAEISKASLYFAIGVPFEKTWLEKLTSINPKMKIVHTDRNIEKRYMSETFQEHEDEDGHNERGHNEHGHDEHGHNEHDDEEHDHSGIDPHIWLSPPLVKKQAETILHALQEAEPEATSFFEANFNDFINEINKLDKDLREVFKGRRGMKFLVFHPSWGYFADTYGLQQIPVEIEGKSPKPSQLIDLIELAKREGIKTVFTQPQISAKASSTLAKEIGGTMIQMDPLAENWTANLRNVAEKIKSSRR